MTPPPNPARSKIEEILLNYFRNVVDKAIEQHGETIVEFAERSKAIRETTATELQHLIETETKRAEQAAVQKFAKKIQDKVRLEFEAGGRYPGHLIQPWEDVARPIIYKAARLTDPAPTEAEGDKA